MENSYFELLPEDLVVVILVNLDFEDFGEITKVYQFNNQIYKRLIQYKYPEFYKRSDINYNWKDIYLGFLYFGGDLDNIKDTLEKVNVDFYGNLYFEKRDKFRIRNMIPIYISPFGNNDISTLFKGSFMNSFMAYLINSGFTDNLKIIVMSLLINNQVEDMVKFIEEYESKSGTQIPNNLIEFILKFGLYNNVDVINEMRNYIQRVDFLYLISDVYFNNKVLEDLLNSDVLEIRFKDKIVYSAISTGTLEGMNQILASVSIYRTSVDQDFISMLLKATVGSNTFNDLLKHYSKKHPQLITFELLQDVLGHMREVFEHDALDYLENLTLIFNQPAMRDKYLK